MQKLFTLFSLTPIQVIKKQRTIIQLLAGCLLLLAGLPAQLLGQTSMKDTLPTRKATFAIQFEANKRAASANAPQLFKQQLKMGVNEQLVRIKTERDPAGFTHEKYEQRYKGVRVEYGILKAHARRGVIESITGDHYTIPEMDIQSRLSESAALQRAIAFVGAKTYRWQNAEEEAWIKKVQKNPKATLYPKGELVICRDFIHSLAEEKMVLAYKFDIYATDPLSRSYVYVDANSGQIIHQNALLKHADGNAATRYSGNRTIQTEQLGANYVLRNSSRGGGVETYNMQKSNNFANAIDFTDADNNWTALELDNTNKDNAALDAHWGAQKVYDYWKNVHGRLGMDGVNGKMKNYIHYGNNWNNAAWNGEGVLYGDGTPDIYNPWTCLDIVGHEFGHAITQHTAGLIYLNESGALNEGFSDIWGAVVEYYIAPEKQTWLVSEDITLTKPSLRSMSNPKAEGDPDTYKGINWYVGSLDNGGVHTNSGVLNHWFYILTVGKTGTNDNGTNYAVNGIGIDKAAKIAYRAESVYLTPTSDFQNTRIATILASTDLYGAGSNEVLQTTNAWDAVGVGSPLTLTLTPVSEIEIGLSWQVQYTSITSFDVERSLSASSGFAVVTQVGSNIYSYNDAGLVAGTTYYYRIKATLANGFIYYSPIETLSTGAPETPTLLVANVSSNTANLSWQDNSSNESNFLVERSLLPTSGFALLATLDPNTTSYQDNAASNVYFYRVRAYRANLNVTSPASNVVRAIVGNVTLMSNTPMTICDQLYMDPYGPERYLDNESFTQTLSPASSNRSISVTFNSFETEDDADFLYIYDGASTAAPLIGRYSGINSPGIVTATNPTGQLTFRFTSDSGQTREGWSATITCQLRLTASATSLTQVSLNWPDEPSETNFLVERSLSATTGFTEIADLDANTTNYLDNVGTNNVYYYRLRTFQSDISAYSGYSNVIRVILGNLTLMSNAPVTTCDQLYLDPGGNDKYSINQSFTQTFTPATENTALQVVFNAFNVEEGYDFLSIYNGATTNAPLIGTYTGTTLPPTIIAHNLTGQLTFQFFSDYDIVESGWSANISCVPVPLAPDQQLSGNEDTPLIITLAASWNTALTYNTLTSPMHGTLSGTAPNLIYTPEANYFGKDTIKYQVTADGFTSRNATVSLMINPVNDAPTFVKGTNQIVPGNAGAQTVTSWATSLSSGPANEAGQSLSFSAVANQPSLFSVQPAVSTNGTLSYTPAPNTSGTTIVSLTLTDNGGTAQGGVNSSTQTFTISTSTLPVLTVTAANQSKAYGQVNPALTFSYSGFVEGEEEADLDTPPSASTTATSASDAGNYPITLSGGVDNKYRFVYQNATLTVQKKSLTVTADNQNRYVGTANPAFTLSYSGFVNGDQATALDVLPLATTQATTGSAPGTYAIMLNGGEDDNYNLVLQPGILTVLPTVTPTCQATGSISRQVWNNVSGETISSIPLMTTPGVSSLLTTFETTSSGMDKYGQRIRGYLCVPTTGNYTFYISGDNHVELYLISDDKAMHKQRIAYISGSNAYSTFRQWNKYSTQKSVSISLQAGKRYYIEALHKESYGGDHLSVGWKKPNATAIEVIPGAALSPYEQEPTCLASGSITRELWKNVPGDLVAQIPVSTAPSTVTPMNLFETTSSGMDKYGQRIRGYICVPTTGNYTFYISGDNNAELWLSPDETAENKQKVAYISGANSYSSLRSWNKYSSQKSVQIALVGGKRYYIEALHKESYGGDHLSVGWKKPNATAIEVISGGHLSPFTTTNPVGRQAQEQVEAEKVQVSVYPNPFESTLTLQTTQTGKLQVSVADNLGRSVYQATHDLQTNELEIDLSKANLKAGMYFISIQTQTGQIHVCRVIKK